MIEQQVDARKPVRFKKFKRRTAEPTINDDNPFADSKPEIAPAAPRLSFVEKLNVLIENNNKPMTQIDVLSGRVRQFQGPEIISWSEDQGRFGLAEKVLKQNDLEFVAMRQRMEAMAGDPDACGGRNEMNPMTENGGLKTTSIVDFGQARLNKILGRNETQKHASGEHGHCTKCKSDLIDGKCSQCAA